MTITIGSSTFDNVFYDADVEEEKRDQKIETIKLKNNNRRGRSGGSGGVAGWNLGGADSGVAWTAT
jgi:hypothetical protein